MIGILTLAHAEHIFVAQEPLGAATGADAADAYGVVFFNRAANWHSPAKIAGRIGQGDTVNLVGTLSTSLIIQGNGTPNAPITILFEEGAKLSASAWDTGPRSAMFADSKSCITIDGNGTGIVECIANGDGLAHRRPACAIDLVGSPTTRNWMIKNLIVRNLYVHLFGSDSAPRLCRGISCMDISNVEISGCSVDNACTGISLSTENVRLVCDLKVHDNIISACSTGVMVALGADGTSIENVSLRHNTVTMGRNWYDPADRNHLDGFHVFGRPATDDAIVHLDVSSNRINGDPSGHCTAGIYLEYEVISPTVCNNSLADETNHPSAGYVDIKRISGRRAQSNPLISHNTIIGVSSKNSGGNAIYLDTTPNDRVRINGNIFSACYAGIYDPNGVDQLESDYNDFHNLGLIGVRGTTCTSLTRWQMVTGGDAHSSTRDPTR